MTHSITAQSTHTNTDNSPISFKTQAGSPKPDILKRKKEKTFMQSYREYYQLMLMGTFGETRPTLSSVMRSRYGKQRAKQLALYSELIHRFPKFNVQ